MISADQAKSSSSSQSLTSILSSSKEPTPPQTDSSNKSDLILSSDKSKANTPSDPSSEEFKKFLQAEPADLTQTILSTYQPIIPRFNKERQRFEESWSRQDKQLSSSKDTDSFFYLLDNLEQLSYEVREYQEEIHRKSQDKNSIIVLGTGSGKTIISILHIVDCLQKHGNLKKVVFLNNNVSLVEQQAKKIRGCLESMTESQDYRFLEKLKPKVLVFHGGKSDHVWDDLNKLKEIPIILAMTPQLLLNGLRKAQISFNDIALLIFDECHHCFGNTLYNQIMEEFYFWPLQIATEKPQILGLTATPILTPKKLTDVDIPRKLLEICMNLDSSFCTLDDREKDLKNKEAELVLWPYQQDSFLETMDILSEADQRKLVNYLMEKDILKIWGVTALDIIKCLNQDPVNVSREPTTKIGTTIKEYFESKMANRAMALLLEFGEYAVYLYFSDVYRKLDEIWATFGYKNNSSSHVSRLGEIKELLQNFLQKISSYNSRYKLTDKCNVFIAKLQSIFSTSNNQIGIVFVERKYMARILDKIINELTSGLVKSHHVIGHNQKGIVMDDDDSVDISQKLTQIPSNQNACISSLTSRNKFLKKATMASTDSLSEVQDLKTTGKQFGKLFNPRQGLKTQLKQIDLFKDGQYDLLIATSIIQEGFDVPNCNFVIAYSEPRNALDLVQMRGRARKEKSQFYVFVPIKKVQKKEEEYRFQFDLMKKIKNFTQNFKLDPANKKVINPNLRQNISENGSRLNNNWSSTLSTLLCKSMPPNSLEQFRPFHVVFEETDFKGQKSFTCLIMLPNQSNVRLAWGEKHSTKDDAKSSAAYYCCLNLKAQNYFDEFLNPKSFNKDQLEFIDLDINPFANQFDSQKLTNSDPDDFHSFFSHFTKKYYKETTTAFKGYLYEIILKDNPLASENHHKICIVLQDELPPGYPLKIDTFTLQPIRPISFTPSEYKNYVLIHRYLVSLVNSPTLLEFFRTLTDEDPISFKFDGVQINHLDSHYELAISHEPSLSFLLLTDSTYKIDQGFQLLLTKYLTHQSKIYQFVNSITSNGDFEPFWDFPSSPEFQITEQDIVSQYIIQDVWKLGKYKFESIEDLKKVDFLASTDGNTSLQYRCLFYIDPLLNVGWNTNGYSQGYEVSNLDNDQKKNIFVSIELLKSPFSLKLYSTLKSALHGLAAFDQAEISFALFKNLTNEQLANKSKKKLEWKIDPNKLLKTLDQFKDQIYDLKTIIFKSYEPPVVTLQNQANYQENSYQNQQEAYKELQNAFILENDSVSNHYFDGVGHALINLLTAIEVIFETPEEWSYSLERIRNKKLQDWKDRSPYWREISKFFVSKYANQYLYDALIFQQEDDKMYSEYLKQKGFIRVIKIYACILYKKETCLIQNTREYLHKIGLLKSTYPKVKIMNKDAYDKSGLIQALYSQKYTRLQKLIDYTFKNRFLLINAFLEISFRDFYVEWLEDHSRLYLDRRIKLSHERKNAFQKKQDEIKISVNSSMEDTSYLFSEEIVSAINFYHDRPNQMDTFRWLGKALVQFIVTEWVYETYSSSVNMTELRMRAKYYSGSRFTPLVSWYYCLEGCLLAPSIYSEKLKKLKQELSAKDLVTKSLYSDSDTDKTLDELRTLCYISSSLFYSLLGAIYVDSFLDLQETRRVALRLLVPVIFENQDLVYDFAPFKIQRICQARSLENPVLRKADLTDRAQSGKYPASSEYQLWIGDTKYASLIENSLANSEYALYVKALEELSK